MKTSYSLEEKHTQRLGQGKRGSTDKEKRGAKRGEEQRKTLTRVEDEVRLTVGSKRQRSKACKGGKAGKE
jgi:hypothetical protein